MKFSTKGRYALRMMVELSSYKQGEQVSLAEIAEKQDISVKYLEQIVTPLSKAGLVVSGRGAQGGYRLSRPANEITAGDILRAAEGSVAPVPCLEATGENGHRCSGCHTLPFWEGMEKVLTEYVDGVTLADLRGQCDDDVHGLI